MSDNDHTHAEHHPHIRKSIMKRPILVTYAATASTISLILHGIAIFRGGF